MRDATSRTACALLTATLLCLVSGAASGLPEPSTPEVTEPVLHAFSMVSFEPVQRVGGDVSRPQKISGENPVYTEMARKAHLTGIVILEAVIDELGNVSDVKVLEGLPMGLDRAAIEAVKTWKFQPATREGRPVKVSYTLTVSFQIEPEPTLGPVLLEFLRHNPSFLWDLHGQRYAEAWSAIDAWVAERPPTFELDALPIFMLVAEGRPDEAASAAAAYQGPERYEILFSLGALTWRWPNAGDESLTGDRRAALCDFGLEVTSAAIAMRPEDALEAMEYKTLLLRAKARLLADEGERRALEEQARELLKTALELRVRRKAAAAAPAE